MAWRTLGATTLVMCALCARGAPKSLMLPAGAEQEHELLEIVLESITNMHVEHEHPQSEKWLRTRAWSGNSHVGNRPVEFQFYYDLVRRAQPKHLCEIGLNGGHSAAVFLAAAGRGARLAMFDLMMWSYSNRSKRHIQALFPGQLQVFRGDSHVTVPQFHQKKGGRWCHFFSVDGDHSYDGARRDFINAIDATRIGGIILADDMQPGTETRRAFDDASAGRLRNVNFRPIPKYMKVYAQWAWVCIAMHYL